MTLPTFPEKHDAPALLTAEDHLGHLDRDFEAVPEAVILAYQSHLVDEVAGQAEQEVAFTEGTLYRLESGVGVLGDFGIGAPVTAGVVEHLAAVGVEAVCILGGGGSLQPDIHGEEALIVDEAIRDEGVSHHYLEPARTVAGTDALREQLERAADDASVAHRVGPTWTTDAIYRETVPEVEHYADEGVLVVEMEVAALFAVARYRGLDAAAVLAAFDALTTEEWTPLLDGERRLERLLPVVTAALRTHCGD